MFNLSPELHARIERDRQAHEDQRIAFVNLSDSDLAASARFWLQHCQAPRQVKAGTVVYDSTFWHIIVPEMIRRLGEHK
jgi:hypothetical protein